MQKVSTAPGSARRPSIQVLTGLTFVNFIERTRIVYFEPDTLIYSKNYKVTVL